MNALLETVCNTSLLYVVCNACIVLLSHNVNFEVLKGVICIAYQHIYGDCCMPVLENVLTLYTCITQTCICAHVLKLRNANLLHFSYMRAANFYSIHVQFICACKAKWQIQNVQDKLLLLIIPL